MPVEIERKFLVRNQSWRSHVESRSHVIQGYLASGANATVRVRVKEDKAWLTIKGPTSRISRSEYEYPIPVADARAMLRELALNEAVEKVRYRVRWGKHLWDLDLFAGRNEGLVMAEVELESENESFEVPDWAGEEVTGDPRYYNAYLARNPFQSW